MVSYAMRADVSDPDALHALGGRNLDGAVVAVSESLEASIMATIISKEMGIPYVLAKAKDELQGAILEKVGGRCHCLSRVRYGGTGGKSLMSTAFADWIELSSEYSMAEVVIPEKWVGRSLSELKIREQYGINVVGIIQGVQVDVTLDPYEPLPEGAILILIGATSVLEKISYMEVRKMITSTSNQRVKELSQIQKKSKIRSREGIFIAEGIRMVRETPHERLVGLYFSESFEKSMEKEVLDVISGGDLKVRGADPQKTEILSDAVFFLMCLIPRRRREYWQLCIRWNILWVR